MGDFVKDTTAIKMPDWRFTLDDLPAYYTVYSSDFTIPAPFTLTYCPNATITLHH